MKIYGFRNLTWCVGVFFHFHVFWLFIALYFCIAYNNTLDKVQNSGITLKTIYDICLWEQFECLVLRTILNGWSWEKFWMFGLEKNFECFVLRKNLNVWSWEQFWILVLRTILNFGLENNFEFWSWEQFWILVLRTILMFDLENNFNAWFWEQF